LTTATNLPPSADDATERQEAPLFPFGPAQVIPESVEVKMPLPLPLATAAKWLPSADDATEYQLTLVGASLNVHKDLAKLEKFPSAD
jgi:hypothetical protein